MKIYGVAAAARDHVEAVRLPPTLDRVTADVVTIQLHHASHRLEVRAVVALRRGNDHGVVLPARAAKIRGCGDLQHVAVPLMVVEDARIRDTGRPRRQHVAAIAARE